MKHLIMKCTKNGNLDTDEFALGLLELRNSPKADGLSPAQKLFGHPIRSILPVHKRAYQVKWQCSKATAAEKRRKNRKDTEFRYDLTAKPLPEFTVGSHVNVQDHRNGRRTITGTVIEVGRNRQYHIRKKDGRCIWRNRKFLRRHHPIHQLYDAKEDKNSFHHNSTPASPRHSPYSTTQANSPKSSLYDDLQSTPYFDPQSSPRPSPRPSPQSSPQSSPIPKANLTNENKSNEFNKLPSTLKTQTSPHMMGRRRNAPTRLQVDPKRKTYMN